jgi:mRNA interferase MazF
MVNMYKILLVDFPYTGSSKSKQRPVLQLTTPVGKFNLILVAYITSQDKDLVESDVSIDNLTNTGLTRKSTIRLVKLINMSATKIKSEIGKLSETKILEVKTKLKKLFGL